MRAHYERVTDGAGDRSVRRAFIEQRGEELDALLVEWQFLSRYPLIVPSTLAGSNSTVAGFKEAVVITEALSLSGPSETPELEVGMHLALAGEIREAVVTDATPVVFARDDPAKQLALSPLALFANDDGLENFLWLETCELDEAGARRLVYRSARATAFTIEATRGSDRDWLLRGMNRIVFLLRQPSVSGEGTATGATVPSRRSAYFFAQQPLIAEHSRAFVGRAETIQAFDRFLAVNRRGYFLLEGGPGQGKTALAAKLVADRGYVHHFIGRTGGRADSRLILSSLLAQIESNAAGGHLERGLRDSEELTKRLEEALHVRATRQRERLVFVVDALNELKDHSADVPPFLPIETLPDNVCVLVTGQAGERFDKLKAALWAVPQQELTLHPLQPADVAQMILAGHPGTSQSVVDKYRPRVARQPPVHSRGAGHSRTRP